MTTNSVIHILVKNFKLHILTPTLKSYICICKIVSIVCPFDFINENKFLRAVAHRPRRFRRQMSSNVHLDGMLIEDLSRRSNISSVNLSYN